MKNIIEARDRTRAGGTATPAGTASPAGLYLKVVIYELKNREWQFSVIYKNWQT